MRWFLRLVCFSFVILPFGHSFATTLTCQASAQPPVVRGEGITERVGDIVLNCSGGQPGQMITGNFSVFLNVNITNRITTAGAVTDVGFTVDNGSGPQPIAATGILSGANQLVYNGLSFMLSATGTATLTISDVRAAANQLNLAPSSQIMASISFNSPVGFTVSSLFSVATQLRGLYVGYSGNLVCEQSGSALPAQISFSNLLATHTAFASTRVTEGFADSFGPKSAWANLNADTGERFIAQYSGFPSGARLFVPQVVAGSDALQPTAGGDLGFTPSGGQYQPGGGGSLLLALVTGADATGAGGTVSYLPGPPNSGPVAFDAVSEITLANGSGYAVYEVVDANASVEESAQFPTFLGLTPFSGSAVQTAESVFFAPSSTVATATTTDPIPRFFAFPVPADCTIVGDCTASYFPRLFTDPMTLQFTGAAGSGAQSGYVRVNNRGGGVMPWTTTITYQQGSGWLTEYFPDGVNNGTIRIDASAANLSPGTYNATLMVDAGPVAGTQSIAISFVVQPAAVAVPTIGSVVNAASFLPVPLAPGSLASIMGSNFTGSTVTVSFDTLPAQVLFSNDTQINLLVPPQLGTKTTTQAVVTVDGKASAARTVPLAAADPAIFPGAVLNQDYSVNNASNPAKLGSVIQIFATGMPGSTPIFAMLAGQTISKPYYGGPAPGLIGVEQVDLVVPSNLAPGTTQVQVCVAATEWFNACSLAAPVNVAH